MVHGITRFRQGHLNHDDSDITVGRWWDWVIGLLVPAQAVILLGWFLYQSWRDDPAGWFKPFDPENVFNVGTVLFQFAVVLVVLILANKAIVARVAKAGR